MDKLDVTKIGSRNFYWGEKTYIMGVINLSPESFSGDGTTSREVAYAQASRFIEEGADIIDFGGESTKPGLAPISTEEEIKRVIPIVEFICQKLPVPVSIDTYKYRVAKQAITAGASILNHQWGLKKGRSIAKLAAKENIPIILMSNQRKNNVFDTKRQSDIGEYKDILSEVMSSLNESIQIALSLGVPKSNIILDPGIGFGKEWHQNMEIINRLDELKALGLPVLVGPSRKSFIGIILNLSVNDRKEGTAAAIAVSIARGADIVRVHDVREMARVCKVTDAIVRNSSKKINSCKNKDLKTHDSLLTKAS